MVSLAYLVPGARDVPVLLLPGRELSVELHELLDLHRDGVRVATMDGAVRVLGEDLRGGPGAGAGLLGSVQIFLRLRLPFQLLLVLAVPSHDLVEDGGVLGVAAPRSVDE